LIYINDFPDTIENADSVLFADDTTLTVSENNVERLGLSVAGDFKTSNDWFTANGLKLNVDKTQLVQFSAKKTLNKIQNLDEIFPSASAKFLGLIIDEHLNWKSQVQTLQNKLSSATYALRVVARAASHNTVMTVYYAYIYPHLRYGVVFWGNSTHSQKIFKIQKTCVRIICNLAPKDSCTPWFRKLNILTLPSLYIFEAILLCRQNLGEDRAPHGYPLRDAPLRYPVHRLALYERGPYYSGLKLYNGLPRALKDINNFKRFKSLLKYHLIKKAYYSVNEYFNN